MAPTLKTRKPVVELSVEDLKVFPIWEYALDEEGIEGRDETWVRPVPKKKIPKNAYSLLVAADFQTAAGEQYQGFVEVATAGGKVDIRPGVIVSKGYFVLPAVPREVAVRENWPWVTQLREKLLVGLKSEEKQVFPIKYRLQVAVSGEANLREGFVE